MDFPFGTCVESCKGSMCLCECAAGMHGEVDIELRAFVFLFGTFNSSSVFLLLTSTTLQQVLTLKAGSEMRLLCC